MPPALPRVARDMKAVTYDNYGDPDVLEVGEHADPRVGPGELLVRVRATSVNPVDWKVMSGALDPLMNARFPVIPGWDVAGVVEQVGLDVADYAVGDDVLAYARKDWVEEGTFAELVSVPVRTAAHKPAGVDWADAGSLPLAGLTAWQTLHRLGTTQGDTVLVHAGSGGVGSFAIQIARHLGARVIATASKRNHELLRDLGAEPVEYGDGLVERVRALAPDGVDVVVDYVGDVLEQTLAVLAPGGRHGSIVDGSVAEHGGLYMWVHPDSGDLTELVQLVEQGEVRVVIDRPYPLEQAAQAFEASKEGRTRGKIAVTVGA